MLVSSRPSSPFLSAPMSPIPLEQLSPTAILLQARAEEQDSIDAWGSFLETYSSGEWSNNPEIPKGLLATKREIADDDAGTQVREWVNQIGEVGVELKLTQAIEVREAFRANGYLVPPLGPHENERRIVCSRFGLDSIGRREALDRIVIMCQTHFDVGFAIISIVLADREIFLSSSGWDSTENDTNYLQPIAPLITSICSHSMLKINPEGGCFIMENIHTDWRFKNNPALQQGNISFFASSNIFLPTATNSANNEPRLLPVGSINLVDPKLREKPFDAADELFLKRLAEMIAREIQCVAEMSRQEDAVKEATFLGKFLRTSLVLPCLIKEPLEDSTRSSIAIPLPTSPLPFDVAAAALKSTITLADSAVIVDLRNFNAPHAPSSLPLSLLTSSEEIVSPPASSNDTTRPSTPATLPRRGGVFNGLAPGDGNLEVSGASAGYDWVSAIERKSSRGCISKFLDQFYADGICEFDSTNSIQTSSLSHILPPSTTALLACPIFDFDGKPALLLIVTSTSKYFRFETSDRQFVENVGAVAIGSLLRRRILEADRAKLAFVSQVSHELRTPLHAIGSQLELIRIVTAPPYLDTIKPLLAVAEVCVTSLREILDDTLTFAKMSNPTDSLAPIRKLHKVVLEDLVEDVIKSCWARTNQHAAIVGDENGVVGVGSNGSGANLKIIMEIEKKLRGCKALVDVGGLKRVLFNLVGNALKFTQVGSITLALKVLSSPSGEIGSSNSHSVVFEVIDTGVGMSEEFLRDQLFIPFRQMDSFSSGAGLGASICDNIVKRMNGSLQFVSEVGLGTTASVAIPLELFFPKTNNIEVALETGFITRIVSDELESLSDLLESNDSGKILLETDAKILLAETAVMSLIEKNDCKGSDILVLVVDDNIIARKILTKFLSVKGVRYIEAENGLEAVKAFKEHTPDLVWCDIQMPILDGLEATRQMRAFEKDDNLPPAYIIALSGLSDSEDGSHCSALASGQISEWLTKGGRSLKILGEGLLRLQTEIIAKRSRHKTAVTIEVFAEKIRNGSITAESIPPQLVEALAVQS